MLNYAYAVLESHMRMQVVAAGLDPNPGVLHGSARGKHGFVLDLMEPMRPVVDRAVLQFVQAHTFHPADFTIRPDGVCRLNQELARCVVRMVTANLERSVRSRFAPAPLSRNQYNLQKHSLRQSRFLIAG